MSKSKIPGLAVKGGIVEVGALLRKHENDRPAFFKGFAEELARMTGAQSFEVLGPSGLLSKYSVSLNFPDGELWGLFTLQEVGEDLSLMGIRLEQKDEEVSYPENSIGAINLLDRRREIIPNIAHTEFILTFLSWFSE